MPEFRPKYTRPGSWQKIVRRVEVDSWDAFLRPGVIVVLNLACGHNRQVKGSRAPNGDLARCKACPKPGEKGATL